MRANTVNFERGKDPKTAMGLGMSKEAYTERIKQLMGSANEDEVYDFIYDLAEDWGGAFEMYLDQANQFEELYWLIKLLGKGKVKVKGFDIEDHYKDTDSDDSQPWDRAYAKLIQPLLNKGWEVWNEENNYDYNEFILVKYPMAKPINEQNFEKGQDPKRAMGIGEMGRTDMRKGIDSMTHFLYYAQPEFIDDIWGDNPMFANHMKEKMANGMDREDTDYMSPSVLMRFVRELDTGNMRMLYDYIIDNHTDKW